MLNFYKVTALALTSLSFYSVSISTLSTSALAGEPIIDRNCRYHVRTQEVLRQIPQRNQARVLSTSQFQVNNQKYVLQLLKFPNSKGVLCLWKPHARLPERLRDVSIIQDKVIGKLEKHPKQPATYIVTVKGDESGDILNTAYRLNLTNPEKPKVTPLIRVYKK
ncbi:MULTISPECIES: hypothetical protein [unclassified Tolypothrix]|uniref:hypothetical protein n=1 Tax=unclassified Tolypothrix TaxID=2649714 RepID=UPI0005EAC02C|nr:MULTISPECIES: hypothetical protein [unclassified Tolypothrix]BAY88543.1 hypothetical protein NIES3275_05200 [Microchaete diplosiphon NIES-3275]EKE97180.1 hypothetical protein FDUTEX481_05391 [Tolypothrix sp. PCC 7601]MBE9085934.1 hypothetical protein [Tolypothrix sp. LEGE 11397]UYD29216.1 hypothetical protein HGR01_14960 [Tolypothrix sp. PCC 7712]UYD34872.1 hypothetical protein HG267_03375 [Tolypothrix sp. PCC 7601]